MKTTINGAPFDFEPRFDETAVDVLRNRAKLTGTKLSCGGGVCGACTILVDGTPIASCLMPANHMEGKEIQTIEAHGTDNLHPIQKALMANEGLQCGFCTPGFVNEGIAFYDRWRAEHGTVEPSRDEVALAMGGHLCRCAAYVGIYAAIQKACAGEYDALSDTPIHRVDAPEKVTGTAKYTVDTLLGNDQLIGKVLRSPHASAIVEHVEMRKAKAMEGVVAVVSLMEGKDRVRWVGQPVAAVAAVDEATATAARDAIDVSYTVLPHAIGIEQARSSDAPEVWDGDHSDMPTAAESMSFPYAWENNVGRMRLGPLLSRRGRKAARAIQQAEAAQSQALVKQRFRNAKQTHTALEPHVAVAKWTGRDYLHVVTSNQDVVATQKRIAEHFDLNEDQITVESQYVGGGFGGKQGMYREVVAAVTLARAANRPVIVAADRLEELAYVSHRPGVESEMGMLVDDDGRLNAITFDAYGDAGIAVGTMAATQYALSAPRGVARALHDHNVTNNTPPGTPFRGPDGPASFWAAEQTIDQLAENRGIGPISLRRLWWPKHKIKTRLMDWVESIPQWQERTPTGAGKGRYQRGIGVATASWPFIYYSDTQVTVSCSPAGIRVSTATQDIGNGTRTSIAKAVEDVLGISRNDVIVEIGDSSLPEGPTTGGSMVTVSLYAPITKATEHIRDHLLAEAQSKLNLKNAKGIEGGVQHADGFTPWSAVLAVAEPHSFTEKRGPERAPLGLHRLGLTLPLGMHLGHSAVVSEVEVDTRLGKIRPINVWTAVAVGKIHVPHLANSQMYSGVIQGLGLALYEEVVYDMATGHTLSVNMNDYRIPGIGDTPDIHIHYDQAGYEDVAGGGIGMAELATIAVAPSVANAVYNATGWRPLNSPITPHDVVTGLKEIK